MMKKRKGNTFMMTSLVMMLIGMMVMPTWSRNLSTMFAGTQSLDISTQARQYAMLNADVIRMTGYDMVANKGRTDIPYSEFQEEIIVGPEKDIGSGNKQKEVLVNIYKKGEISSRYSLKVPLSTVTNNLIPKGAIFPYWGDLANIPAGYVYCDGNNGTPDLRGIYLSGTGNGIALGVRTGNNITTLTTANLPGNALVSLKGYFATGGLVKIDNGDSGDNNDNTYTEVPWGTKDGAEVTYQLTSSVGSYPGYLYFKSFNAAISSMGWHGVPFDNRPASIGVHYIMKIK